MPFTATTFRACGRLICSLDRLVEGPNGGQGIIPRLFLDQDKSLFHRALAAIMAISLRFSGEKKAEVAVAEVSLAPEA